MATIRATVIRPKNLNEKAMRAALLDGLKDVAKDVDADFAKTYATWKRKPEFTTEVEMRDRGGKFTVSTDNEIYRYMDEGTKPHIIRPKKAQKLFFRTGYRAKTTPRVIGSGSGGANGPDVFANVVHHPGTKAREFAETLKEKYQRTFGKSMQRSLNQAAKKSGHGK
jgi:hypothetical protein